MDTAAKKDGFRRPRSRKLRALFTRRGAAHHSVSRPARHHRAARIVVRRPPPKRVRIPVSGLTGGSHPSSRRASSDEKGLSRARKSSDDDVIALNWFPNSSGASDFTAANARVRRPSGSRRSAAADRALRRALEELAHRDVVVVRQIVRLSVRAVERRGAQDPVRDVGRVHDRERVVAAGDHRREAVAQQPRQSRDELSVERAVEHRRAHRRRPELAPRAAPRTPGPPIPASSARRTHSSGMRPSGVDSSVRRPSAAKRCAPYTATLLTCTRRALALAAAAIALRVPSTLGRRNASHPPSGVMTAAAWKITSHPRAARAKLVASRTSPVASVTSARLSRPARAGSRTSARTCHPSRCSRARDACRRAPSRR